MHADRNRWLILQICMNFIMISQLSKNTVCIAAIRQVIAGVSWSSQKDNIMIISENEHISLLTKEAHEVSSQYTVAIRIVRYL